MIREGSTVRDKITGEIKTVVWCGELNNYFGFSDDKGYYEMSCDRFEEVRILKIDDKETK